MTAARPTHTVTCPAPVGVGGLGRHVECLLACIRDGPVKLIARPGGVTAPDVEIASGLAAVLSSYTPARFSLAARVRLANVAFDRAAARALLSTDVLHSFSGAALETQRRAASLGCGDLQLESPTAHVSHVLRRNAEAVRMWGIEGSWLGEAQAEVSRREYADASTIWVTSEYSMATYLEMGFDPGRLRRRKLTAAPRFRPDASRRAPIFTVLYVGSLSVAKGIPVLVEAFSSLPGRAHLILVGGWASRGMRHYLERARARDPRITVTVGDPLPHLQTAHAYIHPSYQDGWGMAPLEAMACGVPVVVSEDTGMKELVVDGTNGYIVPTGSVDALRSRLLDLTDSA